MSRMGHACLCDVTGVYRFSNGQKYEGQWLIGKKHGFCVYTVETNGTWERYSGLSLSQL